jgi:DNA replication protein DnaC
MSARQSGKSQETAAAKAAISERSGLIITSNQPFSQWDQIFPDTMMTVAAIDRIIHHATIIEIEGESYRKKQSLKK